MNQKALNMIKWLAGEQDYFTGITVLQQNGNPPKGIFQTISKKQNDRHSQKLIYLMVKELNYLMGNNEFTEQNYKLVAIKYAETYSKTPFFLDASEPIVNLSIVDNFSLTKEMTEGLVTSFKRLTDDEYAKWFKKQPDEIQQLIRERAKLSNKRAQLHKQCREIKGNSTEAIEKRAPLIQEMDILTEQIKSAHAIIENFKLSGEISPITNEISNNGSAENINDFDISKLSDLQKKRLLDNLKISIRRNKDGLKNLKNKDSKRAIKLKGMIAQKKNQIKILENWYASTKQ